MEDRPQHRATHSQVVLFADVAHHAQHIDCGIELGRGGATQPARVLALWFLLALTLIEGVVILGPRLWWASSTSLELAQAAGDGGAQPCIVAGTPQIEDRVIANREG